METNVMRAMINLAAICGSLGALACAAPVTAQDRGYPHANGYGGYTQIAINRCTEAVQQRLEANRAKTAGVPSVLGVTRVDLGASRSAVTVEGVASSGRSSATVHTDAPPFVDLGWQCSTDGRGTVASIKIDGVESADVAANHRPPVSYEGVDYSQYGYARY